jgi:hypothetical protein
VLVESAAAHIEFGNRFPHTHKLMSQKWTASLVPPLAAPDAGAALRNSEPPAQACLECAPVTFCGDYHLMQWLPITDSLPGDPCPDCDRGELYVRSSRPTGIHWQIQYLRCRNCFATFKARIDRHCLTRTRKVL